MTSASHLVAALAACVLASCGDAPSRAPGAPSPAELTDDAIGYYCGMMLVEHEGPKAQIFLAGETAPKWFSQVRDAVHFLRAPEEFADPVAFYVTDMSDPARRDPAENPLWIDARSAYFVIGARAAGGMGAPEAIPFASADSAARFAAEQGGEVRRLDEIPQAYVEAPFKAPGENEGETHADHQ
ncbi:MAG TPA: copper resistance protein CopZ [Parvularcula sp.]|nr:copper resistance protein CopZ [Parvularcula sp.]HBS33633.1 copper resistance protein CopZ [Parvularcula sp.]